jgi:hypothetical protein
MHQELHGNNLLIFVDCIFTCIQRHCGVLPFRAIADCSYCCCCLPPCSAGSGSFASPAPSPSVLVVDSTVFLVINCVVIIIDYVRRTLIVGHPEQIFLIRVILSRS